MRGIEALSVVEASILPDIPSVATNVTTIMVAERIAAKRPCEHSLATSYRTAQGEIITRPRK